MKNLIYILIINFLVYYFLIPYVQKDANSHMNSGPFFSLLFYFVGFTIICYSVLKKRKQKKIFIELIILALTIIYWGYRFNNIICLKCLESA